VLAGHRQEPDRRYWLAAELVGFGQQGEIEPKSKYHSVTIYNSRLLSLLGYGAPASGTDLLTFQPALQTAEVQHMAARQFLCATALHQRRVVGIPRSHLFSADDTCVLPFEFFSSGVRVLIHML